MCATIISTPDVNTLYNPPLPTKQHLIFSYNVSQDGRKQKEGSSTIPLWTISKSSSDLGPLFCTLLFSSPQRFSMGLRSGDWDGQGRSLILCLVNHFWVNLAVCLGSLSCWKTQWRPIFSFREEATRFWFKMSWYFNAFMMPCTLTVPRAFGRETAPHHHRSSPILHSGHEVLFCILIFCVPPDPLGVFVAKKLYLCLIWPKHTVPVEGHLPLSALQAFAFMILSEYFSYHPPHCAWRQNELTSSSRLVYHFPSCFKLLDDSSDSRYGQV